ncbi:MAG: hypothetical protein FWE50_03040 [Alphaproteobacteria bacterium]|nr:hypothetical protein [Alphaproteobacteria bacterium]
MKKIFLSFTLSLLIGATANAASTYYTGPYQSPQYRYGQPASAQPSYSAPRPQQYQYPTNAQQRSPYSPYSQPQQQQQSGQGANQTSQGFYLSAGISREVANWQFEMKNAGSFLHYDNISWNVFDVNAGYNFDMISIYGGLKYGMQAGESPMIDDDISRGGFWSGYSEEFEQDVFGVALSAGSSKGGSMLNYNLGIGLIDKMNFGNVKVTPSIGYRSLTYNLKTNNNSGIAMEYANYCVAFGDEIQCIPIIFDEETEEGEFLDGTYAFFQPGTTHDYKVSWAGPYLALVTEYQINQNNSVDATIEVGLPAYKSTGDQPYRPDWLHPKSVEDEASIGKAYSLGLGANWKTALTDTLMLSVGFTYNYYTVSGANATTFLDRNYFWAVAQYIVLEDGSFGVDPSDPLFIDAANYVLNELRLSRGANENWVAKSNNEIDSFYKSMGIRIGLSAKF